MVNMYQSAFKHVRAGMFVVDREHIIHAWNRWMVDHTSIQEEMAVGVTLESLYPTLENNRFNWAIAQAIDHNAEQVMSYALNRYLIPIPLESSVDEDGVKLMPQQVYISPIRLDDTNSGAVILLVDMTENVIRSNTLLQVAFKLEEDSHRDILTNAYNRRFLTEWLLQQGKLMDRYNFQISCLLFDLDHFKSINDEYGHDKGDEVLVAFSKYVASTLRDSDVLVRYGGEEFLVLLSHTDLEMAIQIAERLRHRIEHLSVAGLPKGKVTTSIGVACWCDGKSSEYSVLLKAADDALYRAKKSGRNKVCSAHDESNEEGS